MQTFLPYRSFRHSLACLDYRRLGKQRVEALQILNVLDGKSQGWANHPAVRMWEGYEDALVYYHNLAISVWVAWGYNNTMELKDRRASRLVKPSWLDDPAFCLSHKSNLIRKMPEYYGLMWPGVPNDLPYVWPV